MNTRLDSQVVELLGRNRLIDELLRDGLEVAVPLRDRGVDLIAYADLSQKVSAFVSRPIQMKASSQRAFGVHQKYERISELILAYVWHLEDSDAAVTYAMTYPEAVEVARRMGWTQTPSWTDGHAYTTSSPSRRLLEFIAPFRMEHGAWWQLVVGSRALTRMTTAGPPSGRVGGGALRADGGEEVSPRGVRSAKAMDLKEAPNNGMQPPARKARRG